MWVTYYFVGYLILALTIPVGWALSRVWIGARQIREVYCPVAARAAKVSPDPWHAVRMHALGNRELCVKDCSEWPRLGRCEQECLIHVSPS